MNYIHEPWYGTIEQKTENRNSFDYLATIKKPPLCMVQYVTKEVLYEINETRLRDLDIPNFKIGEWVLVSGEGEEITVHPPFTDIQSAMDFARLTLGINNFYQFPVEETNDYASAV